MLISLLQNKWFWAFVIFALVIMAVFFLFIFNPMRTLRSLKKLENGLYIMTYAGSYNILPTTVEEQRKAMRMIGLPYPGEQGNCSIFVTRGDKDNALFGRNYDWDQVPALVLFTNPPGGYASIALVDLTFLGYSLQDDIGLKRYQIMEDMLCQSKGRLSSQDAFNVLQAVADNSYFSAGIMKLIYERVENDGRYQSEGQSSAGAHAVGSGGG